jgi:hypothetical protein
MVISDVAPSVIMIFTSRCERDLRNVMHGLASLGHEAGNDGNNKPSPPQAAGY